MARSKSYLALHILQSHFKWLSESRISSNVSGQVLKRDKVRNKNFLSILLDLNLTLSCSCYHNWHKKLNFIGKNAYLHDHKSIKVTCQMPYTYLLQCAVSAYYSKGCNTPRAPSRDFKTLRMRVWQRLTMVKGNLRLWTACLRNQLEMEGENVRVTN